MEKDSAVRSILALLIITAVAGLFLGFIYQITKEPIEKKREEDKKNAYKVVFENANDFEEMTEINNEAWDEVKKSYNFDKVIINSSVKALSSSGELLGYIITLTTKEGYGGNISITVGISLDKTVNGIEITSINETAGLGAKASTNEYKSQYANKQVDYFEVTKIGKSKDKDNQIDAISGATITTNAITTGVNAAIKYCNEVLIN